MFAINWRCFSSKSIAFAALFSRSLLLLLLLLLFIPPFSVLIKWFNGFEKFDVKVDWLISEFGLISDELYKWLLRCGSGVSVGYCVFWWWADIFDDVVITLECAPTGRKIGTKNKNIQTLILTQINFSKKILLVTGGSNDDGDKRCGEWFDCGVEREDEDEDVVEADDELLWFCCSIAVCCVWIVSPLVFFVLRTVVPLPII